MHKWFLLICLSLLGSNQLRAQESDHGAKVKALIEKGDSLRAAYRFSESIDIYNYAYQLTENEEYASEDSLSRIGLQDKILMAENGRSMTGFVDVPHVVARRKFSLADFFLYYPLRDSCWRSVPNQLDSSTNHDFSKATFVKKQDRTIFWSAPDNEGIRNIYTSSLRDSLWTLPSLLNEQMTSASDEIYPMLSPDGKSLFFSSAGLYGIGGYDIYVSKWDDDINDWGAPVNMGIPYSSPADDFLYIDTEDGHYSFFASNRDCPKDSVWVYVLEYDNVPVRRAVEDPQELVEIARLFPISESFDHYVPSTLTEEQSEIKKYLSEIQEVVRLKDSVSYYSALAAEGRRVDALLNFKNLLADAQGKLLKLEMDLLYKGVVVDPDELLHDTPAPEQVVSHTKGFSFVKNNMGGLLNMLVEEPEVKFDYSFKVLEEAQFAEDQSIPAGVVYQIQLFASKKKARLKELRGLSPIYETAGANSHIVYRVGLFRTYSDVLSNLNTVKKLGFRSAYIVAFVDGKTVPVSKARVKEKEKPEVQDFYEIRMTPQSGELDPSIAAGIRQQAAGKDIARTIKGDGSVVYVVGPFADKAKAEELVIFIKAMGVNDAMCNVIHK